MTRTSRTSSIFKRQTSTLKRVMRLPRLINVVAKGLCGLDEEATTALQAPRPMASSRCDPTAAPPVELHGCCKSRVYAGRKEEVKKICKRRKGLMQTRWKDGSDN